MLAITFLVDLIEKQKEITNSSRAMARVRGTYPAECLHSELQIDWLSNYNTKEPVCQNVYMT